MDSFEFIHGEPGKPLEGNCDIHGFTFDIEVECPVCDGIMWERDRWVTLLQDRITECLDLAKNPKKSNGNDFYAWVNAIGFVLDEGLEVDGWE